MIGRGGRRWNEEGGGTYDLVGSLRFSAACHALLRNKASAPALGVETERRVVKYLIVSCANISNRLSPQVLQLHNINVILHPDVTKQIKNSQRTQAQNSGRTVSGAPRRV